MRFEHLSNLLRSLRFRLTAWNTAVVLFTVGAALVGVREGLRHTLLRETDQQLADEAKEIADAVGESYPRLEPVFHEIDRKAAAHRHQDLFIQLLDARGRIVRSTPNTPTEQLAAVHDWTDDLATAGNYRVAAHRVDRRGGGRHLVRVGASLANVDNDVAVLTHLMTIAAAALLLLAPLGGFWLAGRATRPLGRIIQTADQLRPSYMEERLPIRGTGDQLDQLSITINRFLDLIADYLDRNREFVANAAHELRSPLAAVQSAVEVALNAERSTTEYQDLLCEIVDECRRLGVLVNQLLLLAESDAGELRTPREPTRLDELVATSLDMFRGAAEERDVELSAADTGPMVVIGDAGRLRQVINNLIDNGLKFTPRGGRIGVDLRHDPAAGQVVLSVSDSGCGISASDLPHVFERFFRGDRSRQRGDPLRGSGLGLSICQSIVVAHGGDIRVTSVVDHGATFEVRLPADVSASPGPAAAQAVSWGDLPRSPASAT
jgi:heavy metal sensor kinase